MPVLAQLDSRFEIGLAPRKLRPWKLPVNSGTWVAATIRLIAWHVLLLDRPRQRKSARSRRSKSSCSSPILTTTSEPLLLAGHGCGSVAAAAARKKAAERYPRLGALVPERSGCLGTGSARPPTADRSALEIPQTRNTLAAAPAGVGLCERREPKWRIEGLQSHGRLIVRITAHAVSTSMVRRRSQV